MELNEILTIAVKARGSDIHLKAGLPPIVRIDGKLRPIPNAARMSPDADSRDGLRHHEREAEKPSSRKISRSTSPTASGSRAVSGSTSSPSGAPSPWCSVSSPSTSPPWTALNLPPVLEKIAWRSAA